ncbi:MAG TPA: hypothetical protein VFA94_08935 [Acidimicrobiales bacterium]|nr:hypothetical protein [Acidimicrobiales bacterium]
MTEIVESTRVTLVWTLSDPQMLVDGSGAFSTRAKFASAFSRDPDGHDKPAFVPAWHQRGFSHFWAYYVGLDYPKRTSVSLGWNRLVPLRDRSARKPLAANTPRLWSYVWPHGVAAVLELEVDSVGQDLTRTVSRVVSAATTDRYNFGGGVYDDAAQVLRTAADTALRQAGGDPARATHPDRYFAISTVISGAGDAAPESDDSIWRAVHGLACLNPRWQFLSLHAVQEGRISSRPEYADGGGLYGVPRGRVVWLPWRFSDSANENALTWYHQNLSDLALQVEGNLSLVRWAASALTRTKLSFEVTELVRRAAQNLARLSTAARPGTYASMSARRHIEEDDVVAVRAVWDYFGLMLPPPAVPARHAETA